MARQRLLPGPLHARARPRNGSHGAADSYVLSGQPFNPTFVYPTYGSIVAQRAVAAALPADVVREGEVVDERALSDALRELFAGSGLGKRVRVGVANQRTVMRTLELPPVSDPKELAAAVQFQAQDQIPMPLPKLHRPQFGGGIILYDVNKLALGRHLRCCRRHKHCPLKCAQD